MALHRSSAVRNLLRSPSSSSVRQVSAYEQSVYQSCMRGLRAALQHANPSSPRRAEVHIYIHVQILPSLRHCIPRRRDARYVSRVSDSGGPVVAVYSPSPGSYYSRRKGVTRSGRAAHRSPHYLRDALLNIQNAPNAKEARHAHAARQCAWHDGEKRETVQEVQDVRDATETRKRVETFHSAKPRWWDYGLIWRLQDVELSRYGFPFPLGRLNKITFTWHA